ncbi:protein TILLER ANGLE CONTROL 1 [Vitis vinifera]|nr:protein TILLER ANGLE CONTROL 1 [Vitis vinifera]|eukprot:XP_010661481.1 PREDICTED: uncharacterized protein LOC104881847 [Vitis vinifera]
MKIFNWVHRRFNHNVHSTPISLQKDGLAANLKKVESITNDTDTQALLKHVALVDMLDGWKDGILAIGTLGFDDPLYSFSSEKECAMTDEEEGEDEEEEEVYSLNNENGEVEDEDEEDETEVNPLVFSAFGDNVPKPIPIMTVDGVPLSRFVGSSHEVGIESFTTENDQRKSKGERTTLADLFSADSEVRAKVDPEGLKVDSGKKPAPRSKNGLSFAKKLIPRVGEDSRPIKKLHQLMTRMLKRKIHPELEGKIQKPEDQIKASTAVGGLATVGNGAIESVSLLQTQDATMV